MEEEKKEKKGFFARLVSGLTKTRDNIVSGIDSVFHGFSHIDDDFYEELEEILIMSGRPWCTCHRGNFGQVKGTCQRRKNQRAGRL